MRGRSASQLPPAARRQNRLNLARSSHHRVFDPPEVLYNVLVPRGGNEVTRNWVAGLLIVLLAMPAQAQFIIFTGPSQPPVPFARPGNYDNVQTVAVLSGIGQTLTLERTTVLLPQIKKIDISGWGYDDAISTLIKRYLADRFKIKDVDYDKSALAAISDRFWESPI
jgi:hypothetical protein